MRQIIILVQVLYIRWLNSRQRISLTHKLQPFAKAKPGNTPEYQREKLLLYFMDNKKIGDKIVIRTQFNERIRHAGLLMF